MSRIINISINEVQDKINLIQDSLMETIPNFVAVTANELIAYFDGPAPSGDVTTLNDILDSKWLLIHELVEMSELKNQGFEISVDLLTTNPVEVDFAHATALDYEIKFAKNGGDKEWAKRRLNGLKEWIHDDPQPNSLKERILQIFESHQ